MKYNNIILIKNKNSCFILFMNENIIKNDYK